MSDQALSLPREFSSSGGWFPAGTMIPPKRVSLNFLSDASDKEKKEIAGYAVEYMTIAETIGRTYPGWLNFVAGITLLLIPIGLVLIFVFPGIIGLVILGAGFLGIWIFGNQAVLVGRDIKRFKVVRTSRRA